MIVGWLFHWVGGHEIMSLVLFIGAMVVIESMEPGVVRKHRKRLGGRRPRPKFTRPVISLHGENEVSGRPEGVRWVHGEPGPRVERRRRWGR